MSSNSNNLASDIWSLADLLRGDFKQSQYGSGGVKWGQTTVFFLDK